MKQQKSLKRTRLIGLCAAVALAAGISAQAQLSLVINTGAKTVSLSGSDSGTFALIGAWYEASWKLFPGGFVTSQQNLPVSNAGSSTWFSLNPGNIGGLLNSAIILNSSDSSVVLALFADAGAQTVSGLGTPISYSGLSAANQAVFESTIGQTLPLFQGQSFGGISVVPEPHEYALLAGLGLIGFAGFRRWRQRA